MKPALIIIDMQQAFYKGKTAKLMDAATDYINYILPLFRRKKLPVIWVQDMDKDDGIVPGTKGFDLIKGLKPAIGEKKITKQYGNSFNKTDLEATLRHAGVDMVILAGYCAEYCVLSTYRGALDRDLTPIMLRGALASNRQKNIDFVLAISDIISCNALRRFLSAPVA